MADSPTIDITTTTTGRFDTEIITVFQDLGKKAITPEGPYSETVEKVKKTGVFTASHGSTQFIRFAGEKKAENLLLVGMGIASELTEERVRLAAGQASARIRAEKSYSCLLDPKILTQAKDLRAELHPVMLLAAWSEGFTLGAYEFNKYKTTSKAQGKAATSSSRSAQKSAEPKRVPHLTLTVADKKMRENLQEMARQVEATNEALRITRDWSNEPSNFGTPSYYAEEAKKWAKKLGLKVKVLGEKQAAQERMGLFLGVGKGAEQEAKVVILEYAPKNRRAAKTVALVGKGVTFDSGGISIKPSLRMEEMKHDMTGAATVMGAIALAARWQIPNRVIAVMAFTENMPDAAAIQPGNILKSRSGKTVEIINTDAEGRLVLADALDLVQDYQPDVIVDVATLTGAVSIALGKYCCAVLGNEQTLIDALCRAGAVTGERMWQLPLYDEYFEDLKSDYADMKNSANDSYGGTVRGAMFLKQFIRKNVHWAHLDIAATATNLGYLSYFPKKGASGAYVRALARFAADY